MSVWFLVYDGVGLWFWDIGKWRHHVHTNPGGHHCLPMGVVGEGTTLQRRTVISPQRLWFQGCWSVWPTCSLLMQGASLHPNGCGQGSHNCIYHCRAESNVTTRIVIWGCWSVEASYPPLMQGGNLHVNKCAWGELQLNDLNVCLVLVEGMDCGSWVLVSGGIMSTTNQGAPLYTWLGRPQLHWSSCRSEKAIFPQELWFWGVGQWSPRLKKPKTTSLSSPQLCRFQAERCGD